MCDTTQRLIALLRILEQGPAPFGMLGDDAMLDACFGHRSTLTLSTDQPPGGAQDGWWVPKVGRHRA